MTFLEEWEFTKNTPLVKTIAKQLRESTKYSWRAASDYVAFLKINTSNKGTIFRKRTTSEILESDYVTGRTNIKLTFIALARELKIPTRYVETFDSTWVQNTNSNERIKGCVFVDILVDNNWKAYEPKNRLTKNNCYSMNERKYAVVRKGLDFSKVYIKKMKYIQHNQQNFNRWMKPQDYLSPKPILQINQLFIKFKNNLTQHANNSPFKNKNLKKKMKY